MSGVLGTGPCHRAGVRTVLDSQSGDDYTRFSRTAIHLSFSSLRSRKAFTSSTKSKMDFCWSRIAEVSQVRKSNDFLISSKSSMAGFFFGPILATGRSFFLTGRSFRRDLSFGWVLLFKTEGLSRIVYPAKVLDVPKTIIKK